jgi:hypothetical protein
MYSTSSETKRRPALWRGIAATNAEIIDAHVQKLGEPTRHTARSKFPFRVLWRSSQSGFSNR